jgi:hypothetical protein
MPLIYPPIFGFKNKSEDRQAGGAQGLIQSTNSNRRWEFLGVFDLLDVWSWNGLHFYKISAMF